MAATVTTPNAFFKGALLDYFYIRRASSAIGQGVQFKLTKAYFGTSALVTANPASTGGWLIANIPTTFQKTDLTTNFASTNLVLTVTGSTININATLAADAIKDNVPHNFNTLVLVDAEDKAVAVLCCQQDTLYTGKSFTLLMNIEEKVS